MAKYKVKYSGKRSSKFWKLVGRMYNKSQKKWEEAYDIGCQIQELETKLEKLLK